VTLFNLFSVHIFRSYYLDLVLKNKHAIVIKTTRAPLVHNFEDHVPFMAFDITGM